MNPDDEYEEGEDQYDINDAQTSDDDLQFDDTHEDGPGDEDIHSNNEETDQYLDDDPQIDVSDSSSVDEPAQIDVRSKRTRGPTKLAKMKAKFVDDGCIRKQVRFDRFGNLKCKNGAEFSSFIGDLVREKIGLTVNRWKEVLKERRDKLWDSIQVYYTIKEVNKKFVMSRLAASLRNFRKNVYAVYISPKLEENKILGRITQLSDFQKVPTNLYFVRKETEWHAYVKHVLFEEFQKVSNRNKEVRKKVELQHNRGRGGYRLVRKRLAATNLLENKGVKETRIVLWTKAFENKDGVIKKILKRKRKLRKFWQLMRR